MNFVIPKKKRAVEKPVVDISSLEPKATIEDAPKDSDKFNTVKNIVLNGLSDRQVQQFLNVDKAQTIKNPFLEYKYDQFKANLRSCGQSDAESYEFLLLGYDNDDLTHIADNGYAVGTSFIGDLGAPTRGVYLYRYVDLVSPSLFYKEETMRVMVFRTLRGKSYSVGLGSTELEPTMECCSHIAANDGIPNSRKSRQQLHRQAAVYHYEYNKDLSVAEVPSGVLPFAVVDLKFNLPEKTHYSNFLSAAGYINEALYFTPVYEGSLNILAAKFPRAVLSTSFEDSNKPHGLDESLGFTKLLLWADVFDIKGVSQLMAQDTWGLIARQREVCVKNDSDREKWKVRYVSHFIWTCADPRFITLINSMRVEQCAAVAYSIDASTHIAFPSGQFSSILGLPWLHTPALHVLIINTNPLFYFDPNDEFCLNEESVLATKTPLGTAILDGDDVALCRFFDSQAAPQLNTTDNGNGSVRPPPRVQAINGDSPRKESPRQSIDEVPSTPQSDTDAEHTPPPAVNLPSSAGKSCLRSKPPQVFVEQPPLIGKSVPPPPPIPGAPRVASHAPLPRKTRIRWAENVVDNEHKFGKKLSNDRDEAVKAGLHTRAPPKDLLTRKPPAPVPPPLATMPPNTPAFGVSPGPSAPPAGGIKYKDLFQGVFSTIAKGKGIDNESNNDELVPSTLPSTSETSKMPIIPKRIGGNKNCIITSLPLPSIGRSAEANKELAGASSSAAQPEDPTVCDMEIESSSEGTPTPPQAKSSPDGFDDAVDFIDDQDEDYDAQFKCEIVDEPSDSPQGPASPVPAAQSVGPPTTTIPVETENSQKETEIEVSTLLKELAPKKEEKSVLESLIDSDTPPSEAPASPPSSPPRTEMPENVVRLLELLRGNETSSKSRDTDLRKEIPVTSASAATNPEFGRPRKSRFDQPPPEIAGAGFVPKPVPTSSIGYVGTVPALGSSVKDTDLRSQPPATLAFSIKKTTTTSALNPPAPLIFGEDVDDEDVADNQRIKTNERKDRDDRVKRWDKPADVTVKTITTQPEAPRNTVPPNLVPGKDKPPENRLFHLLTGARMLQSQRDKQGGDFVPPITTQSQSTPYSAPLTQSGVTPLPRTLPMAVGASNASTSAPSSTSTPVTSTSTTPLSRVPVTVGANATRNTSFFQSTTTMSASAIQSSRMPVTVASNASSNTTVTKSTSLTSTSTSQSSKFDTIGNAFGLSNNVIQQLLKRSSSSSQLPQSAQNSAPEKVQDAPASPDPPASPEPEGPASPDAPASPDPEERPVNGLIPLNPKPHSEIPLDCWQPTEDKRPEPPKIITVRTPKKPKRPKDIDGIVCKGGEDQLMHSWIKAVEQKSETSSKKATSSRSSRSADEEEEEGEILSDGSDEVEEKPPPKPVPVQEKPKPISVIGASTNNFHSTIVKKTTKPDTATKISPFQPGVFPPQAVVRPFTSEPNPVTQRGFPSFPRNGPFGTVSPWASNFPPPARPVQVSPFQFGLPRQEAPSITVIVPDFMMFNRAAMARMDPPGFEAFCERLKVIQTKENRIVSLQIHERLLQYLREMMQSLAGSEAGNAFHMYYSIIAKYKEFGIVQFMVRHACDDGDVCAAQTINCFSGLRSHYHPSTVIIYMSNMSPSSATGTALSSLGVRVITPCNVMRTFGFDTQRSPFLS
ncbi:unnamed protein product [Cylicocyclus nassatus]|uniref:DUF3715 domain-containing protein n=1 Tax=Cylicocyclus nassatus TaxID=53992 RepID=A0AA36H5K0_CYLNA|nr:unnamed protein product [Cylicocyclus nassatus]